MFDLLDPLTPENFVRLSINGWIVNGLGGGLIVGRSHDDGHIVMIGHSENLGEFVHAGFVQGGEYLVNAAATTKYWDRLHEINADKSQLNRPGFCRHL